MYLDIRYRVKTTLEIVGDTIWTYSAPGSAICLAGTLAYLGMGRFVEQCMLDIG